MVCNAWGCWTVSTPFHFLTTHNVATHNVAGGFVDLRPVPRADPPARTTFKKFATYKLVRVCIIMILIKIILDILVIF
jgi:hypothetical protein